MHLKFLWHLCSIYKGVYEQECSHSLRCTKSENLCIVPYERRPYVFSDIAMQDFGLETYRDPGTRLSSKNNTFRCAWQWSWTETLCFGWNSTKEEKRQQRQTKDVWNDMQSKWFIQLECIQTTPPQSAYGAEHLWRAFRGTPSSLVREEVCKHPRQTIPHGFTNPSFLETPQFQI